MYLCVVGKLAFSIKSSSDDESDNDLDPGQDQDQQQTQNQDVVPILWKTMSEIYQKLDEEDPGTFIIMESFMTGIHKLVYEQIL